MLANFSTPTLWIPSGGAQRLIGLSAVKPITFGPNEQGCYLQTLTQNVRVTIALPPTTSTPKGAAPNSLGFQLKAGDPAVLFTGIPGMVLNFIEETASAEIQYQMLTLANRFTG